MRMQSDYWEIAENWYKRTQRLRAIFADENESPARRAKALKLFQSMFMRMKTLSYGAMLMHTPKPEFAEKGIAVQRKFNKN
jgi:hypothetical protein